MAFNINGCLRVIFNIFFCFPSKDIELNCTKTLINVEKKSL